MADLAGMDAEIKKIEQVKNKYRSLLEIERKINESMLYSVGVRKKYTDALSATTSAQKDLMEKEHKLETRIVHTATSLQKSYAVQKKLLKEQGKLLAKQATTARTDPKFKEQEKRLKEIKKALSGNNKDIALFKKYLNTSTKEVKKLKGNAKDLEASFSDLARIDKSTISSSKDLNDLSLKRADIMKQQLDIQRKAGTISDEEAKDLKDKLSSLEQIQDIQGDLLKRNVSEDLAPMVDELTKSAKDLTSVKGFKVSPGKAAARGREAAESRMGVGLMGQQAQSLKSLFSTRSSFGEKMGSIKSFKDAQKDMSKLNTIMGVTGKKAMTAGGMMKMLGTALGSLGKLGWIGLIITAVTAVAKAVNELDKFLKGFNQTFAKLHGPTVLMKDIGKSMGTFTDSIFDLQRNLRLGLKSADIIGMFQGIAESGMSLQGLLKKVSGGYVEMIEQAAKVRLDFGVSMEEAAAMLGEQMTDLRYSVDEAAEGFKTLSYDASIAGIQSQKFYQATYAAAEALSYYGKFLDTASTTLKNFQQQGAMGFKDAQKQTQTMTNLFKDMDNNQRVMFMNMSGGVESYRQDFIKLAEESKNKIGESLTKLKGSEEELARAREKGDEEEITRLNSVISAEKEQLKTLQSTYATAKAASEGNVQDMAVHLEALSDTIGKRMGEYFKMLKKNHGPDVFKDFRAALEHMKAMIPVSDEFARNLEKSLLTSREGVRQMAAELDKALPEGERSKFGDQIAKIMDESMENGALNRKKVETGLSQIEQLTAKDIDTIMKSINDFPHAVKEFMKTGYRNVTDNVERIVLEEMEGVKQVTGETREDQNKRLEDIVNNTTTIEDFIGINKESAKYLLAGNKLQKGAALAAVQTAKSTGGIYNFLQGRWGKGKEKVLNEPEKDDLYRGVKEMGAAVKVLEAQKATTKDKEKQKEYQKEIDRLKEDSAKREESIMKKYGEDIGSRLITMAEEASGSRAGDILKTKKDTEEQIRNLLAESSAKIGTDIEGAKKAYNKAQAIKSEYEKSGSYMAYSDKKVELSQEAMRPVPQKKDFKANTSGYALLTKGDVVVNARNMSTGMSGDIGSFAGTAASDMMRSFSSGGKPTAAPSIPVTISIGSVSGDPEDFLKAIKPAIEQAFERMYFDKQKRK